MIQGAQVEVARLVVGLGGGLALLVGLEQEELRLRAHIEAVVAHVVGLLDHPLEHVAGSPTKGVPSVLYTSQISRATLPWLGRQGNTRKLFRSG